MKAILSYLGVAQEVLDLAGEDLTEHEESFLVAGNPVLLGNEGPFANLLDHWPFP